MNLMFSIKLACRLVATTSLLGLSATAIAQTAEKKNQSPWEISAGIGVRLGAEYEGASKRVSGLAPSFSIGYRTDGFGTFAAGARGLSWTVVEKDDYSFGVAIAPGVGRVDNKDGTLYRLGSKRLKGMGEIKSAADVSIYGHVMAGLPLELEITRNTGDGKLKNNAFEGHGGTTISFGTTLPYEVMPSLTLSFSPKLIWADQKYTQAFFGVTAAQSAASGFKAFKADGGIKSIDMNLGANYKIDKNWSANGGVNYSVLRGNAAKSPIVQKKSSASLYAGVTYQF